MFKKALLIFGHNHAWRIRDSTVLLLMKNPRICLLQLTFRLNLLRETLETGLRWWKGESASTARGGLVGCGAESKMKGDQKGRGMRSCGWDAQCQDGDEVDDGPDTLDQVRAELCLMWSRQKTNDG